MRSAQASGPSARQTRTKHIVDELPVTLVRPPGTVGEEPTRSVLQLELHTWNADAVAPTDVTPLPAAAPTVPRGISASGDNGGGVNDILIERLMHEIDEKKDVIRRCGVEVIELRKQSAQLAAHNADLRSMLEREKYASSAMAHEGDEEWEMLTLEELRQRSRLLRKKYRGERQANETLVNKLQLLQNAVMKKNAAEDRLRELEEAHLSQSELVARLRAENTTVGKYRRTVHEQESVIVKLEQLMESALSDKKRLQVIAQAIPPQLSFPGIALTSLVIQAALDDAAVHQRPGGAHDGAGRKISAAAQGENDGLRAEIANERTKRLGKKSHNRTHAAARRTLCGSLQSASFSHLLWSVSAAERRTTELEEQVAELEKATNDDTQSDDRRTLLMKAERAETRARENEKQVRDALCCACHSIPR